MTTARTVGELVTLLRDLDPGLPFTIEETGEGAVGYELQDHGVVGGSLVLVFDNTVGK